MGKRLKTAPKYMSLKEKRIWCSHHKVGFSKIPPYAMVMGGNENQLGVW